jgi:predicted MFS family arabinose efflux permease
MLGPVLGALIYSALNYRGTFFAFTLVLTLFLILILILLPNRINKSNKLKDTI